ncbi:hypothetical protein SAZ_33315 [Streptomyces noursei ZPM]|uniref:preprotein translocase subunit SecD n=1 Tax=Streptomyces noursei TaxID=1971 RepID=UPI00033EE597|nr:preprotein translocase subunit SecD [Streptomyces noursei]AKA09011.1 hypothetical protein SAZ_33315 [Streptomyces noursei ZPM]EOS97342.1 hypothetical protein K530_44505 [Streptomyces noursei CCRC 11814]EXU92691.1 hypothetical protein P354_15880 [Streptomyces noursei PD-1]UWS75283.1 hypothetical protein N1H47_31065 [Streptomyces noursei]
MRTPPLLVLTAAVLATVTGCMSVPASRTAPPGPRPAPSVPERPATRAPSEGTAHEQVVTAPRPPEPPADAAVAEADGTAADAPAPHRGRLPAAPHPQHPRPAHHRERPRPAQAAPPPHHPAVRAPAAHRTVDPRMICQMAAGKVRPDLLTLCQGSFGQ